MIRAISIGESENKKSRIWENFTQSINPNLIQTISDKISENFRNY